MELAAMTRAEAPDALEAVVIQLFEQYYAPLCAYVSRLTNDPVLMHDLVQETFARLYREREKLTKVENQRAWLYRIATHVALDAMKRQQRFTWLPWHHTESAPRTEASPAEQVSQRLEIEQALAQLPLRYRTPLLLFSYYGFSVREIAEVLELSETAVTTRLYRAKELFRQACEMEGGS